MGGQAPLPPQPRRRKASADLHFHFLFKKEVFRVELCPQNGLSRSQPRHLISSENRVSVDVISSKDEVVLEQGGPNPHMTGVLS